MWLALAWPARAGPAGGSFRVGEISEVRHQKNGRWSIFGTGLDGIGVVAVPFLLITRS